MHVDPGHGRQRETRFGLRDAARLHRGRSAHVQGGNRAQPGQRAGRSRQEMRRETAALFVLMLEHSSWVKRSPKRFAQDGHEQFGDPLMAGVVRVHAVERERARVSGDEGRVPRGSALRLERPAARRRWRLRKRVGLFCSLHNFRHGHFAFLGQRAAGNDSGGGSLKESSARTFSSHRCAPARVSSSEECRGPPAT